MGHPFPFSAEEYVSALRVPVSGPVLECDAHSFACITITLAHVVLWQTRSDLSPSTEDLDQ